MAVSLLARSVLTAPAPIQEAPGWGDYGWEENGPLEPVVHAMPVRKPMPALEDWYREVTPGYHWHWEYLRRIDDVLAAISRGECKRAIFMVPPRHGKSQKITVRFPVFWLEQQPDQRVIIAAYNQILANKFSRQARRIAASLGPSRLALSPDRTAVDDWETFEGGGVRAVGVGGGVTGQGANLIIIDDPVKNREEADSETYREKVWDWYTDDLYTRLEPHAALILIQTRWHADDLAGRILLSEEADSFTVIRFPGLAETQAERDEAHRRLHMPIGIPDPLGREPGQALCPERYDEIELARIRKTVGGFNALYQQDPKPDEGGMFPRTGFSLTDSCAPFHARRVRYWDKAGTEGGGCYTCGVLMAFTDAGVPIIEDVKREQFAAGEREKLILATAEEDARRWGNTVHIWIEQEPGSGGKESAENTFNRLARFPRHLDKVSGDKEVRALPLATHVQNLGILLVRAPWNFEFIQELTGFPNARFKDQVDAAAGAYNKLALMPVPAGPVAGGERYHAQAGESAAVVKAPAPPATPAPRAIPAVVQRARQSGSISTGLVRPGAPRGLR